jgi:FtsP/CotA-like multicopper oxidase with cupredoxin domain
MREMALVNCVRLRNDRLPRTLKLGTASQWMLKGEGGYPHPFHIHVNPFEVERREPGADGQMTAVKVWKDTINVPADGSPIVVWSRYLRFEGEFVLHCHILGHEDMGMMQRIRISK